MSRQQANSPIESENPSSQENTFKTVKEREFARLVGLSLANLQRLRKRGEVAHLRVGRRVLYVVPDHFDRFIKRYNQPVTVVRN